MMLFSSWYPGARAGRAHRLAVLFSCGSLLLSCQDIETGRPGRGTDQQKEFVRDIHSFSRPERLRVTHADIDWTVDFEARQIRGSVAWTVERAPGAESEPLILDTRDLTVEAVTSADGASLSFAFGEPHPALGTPLRINLPAGEDRVVVLYHTAPEAAALQWLSPEQTAGKKHPFLFSQAQSILARTMLPCQDSPGVRITYTANVHTPPGLRTVMAARHLPEGEDAGTFHFEMPQPIPSYLIAIAVGDIAFRKLGPRSGVYAEPSVVDAAAYEFADTEVMIDATEKLYGPYRWERYDTIVLPPSFPFGGMENPRLTFATPTVLVGDRSLVSLVAHELAHSWSGNLVTNATWSDFWMNEGFTVYLHRRILEEVYGEERARIDAVLGKQGLLNEMPGLEEGFTVLHNQSLDGRDPDDAFSEVPYEKGYLFLILLESEVGRPRFDAFLRAWFDENAFQSRTTSDFVDALRKDLFAGDRTRLDRLKINEWLYEPGLPDNAPEPHSAALVSAKNSATEFASGVRSAESLPSKGWSTQEWLYFLLALPEDMPPSRMAELDAAWSLTQSKNSEILMQWLLQSVRSGYEKVHPSLERFLTVQGRRKFLKPLYTEMARTPEGKSRALAIYERARSLYHPVSRNTIDEILAYEPS